MSSALASKEVTGSTKSKGASAVTAAAETLRRGCGSAAAPLPQLSPKVKLGMGHNGHVASSLVAAYAAGGGERAQRPRGGEHVG